MVSLPLLAACLGLLPSDAPAPASVNVRVGVVAYEDFRHEVGYFEEVFAELSRQDPTLRFQLAVGSYGDMIHWLDEREVDVAILTPGLFAGLISPTAAEPPLEKYRYLATLLLPAAHSSWASAERRREDFFGEYFSVCLVPNDSPIKSVDDLRQWAEQGRVEFLFVHPVSLSGRAVPLQALRQADISTEKCTTRFTYSHSQSIRLLHDAPGERQRVAFVWDDATADDPALEAGVRQVPFPQLAELSLPHSVMVSRADWKDAAHVQRLLTGNAAPQLHYRFEVVPNWESRFRTVRTWLTAAGITTSLDEGSSISLEEIGHQLLQYARSQPRPPRLALVLSGGGARCSYQVGAVAAVEEKLAQLRRENPDTSLDIQLVVGTSGGAINALPVALGVSRLKAGQAAFRDTWCQLNQCEIVRPPLAVRIAQGLWFALVQTALVIWLVRWLVTGPTRRGWTFAAVYTALAGLEVLLGYLHFTPWRWLGSNHVIHHIWLWLSFGVRASAWSLFAIGIGAMCLQALRARRGDHIRVPRRLTNSALVAGLLGLPLLQLVMTLWFEETISTGRGMERTLDEKYPPLIDRYLELIHQPPLTAEDSTRATARIQSASRQIIERGLLARDLVITGSCLRQSSQQLPPDLYFYAPADPRQTVTAFGERGISLIETPQILFDVILGSGSIFPVFPARRIDDVPRAGEYIELVDGGYAHNSPIEAAVLWGATHIILIDVMSYSRAESGNFARNVMSSVQHLHQQAQLLDARARGKVDIFTLAPQPPHLCVIDFADNLIAPSIDRGYHDATIDAAISPPRFRKELGKPVFTDVPPGPGP
jgi:predicted acylesterase/phospholipase RssA/ABC-type phosphate/phosphonate transport system substrate-binding protein